MSENRAMTHEEKRLLQAQHRLEEAEARQLVKDRKARTRRLIQEGAILESVVPWIANIEMDALKRILEGRLKDL